MTPDLYEFDPYRDSFTITCPKCGGAATFRFPFTLLEARQRDQAAIQAAQNDPNVRVLKSGGGYVIEHFPNIFTWEARPEPYREPEWGVVTCPNCGLKAKHKLSWPEDAYFSVEVRGQTLWAWTRQHALALRAFIASSSREPLDYPGYAQFLMHIPTIFLLAKNREAVVRALDETVAH